MEGREKKAQIGHAEEKSEDIAPPVDQAACLARMLKMLEKIDIRVDQIEARQNGSSALEALRSLLVYQQSPSHSTARSRTGHDRSCSF